MKKTSKAKRTESAESIARLAGKGQDVSAYFTNKGKMVPPRESCETEPSEDASECLNEALGANRLVDVTKR